MQESTVTAKGQTTLPRDIRQHLGLNPGDRVRYLVVGDEVRLVRPRKVMTLCGALRHTGEPVSLEDMDQAVRDGAAKADRHSREGGNLPEPTGRSPTSQE